MLSRLIVAVFFLPLAGLLLGGQELQFQMPPAQGAIVGQNYTLPLTVTGGTQPYTWSLAGGQLPPGCRLQKHKGAITCVPTTPGDYKFTVVVSDGSIPQVQVQRDLTLHVIAGVTIEWKDGPKVQGTTISGSAIVSNGTPDEFDLTVIIVAVNDIGRATALGYQHIKLAGQASSPVIPFGAAPGPGTYYVRADAVAHRPGHRHSYRASKQTPSTITVTQY
jgi:Putative Ig domain